MRTVRVLSIVFLCFAALLALSGCGTGTASPAKPVPTAPTVTLTASPTTIGPNGSTTLTWSSTAATSVSIDQGVGAIGSSGQATVKPTQTTTYTITATGAGGSTTAAVTVTVSASATSITLVANPTTVASGGPSTLTVTASNATSVVISNNLNSTTYPLALSGGTQIVKPTQNTIYTATATGASGNVTATATVAVTPTVTITATPIVVASGVTSTLNVTATNATSVVISDNLDAATFPLGLTGGTQNVTPTKTTIYTATATGLGGTATKTVTVTVGLGTVQAVNHVLFLMQENRTFDTYFGMLNPYRKAQSTPGVSGAMQPWNIGDDGKEYDVDGIEDKLATTNPTDPGNPLVPQQDIPLFKTTSTCLDDMTSAFLESYGDVNRFDHASPQRAMLMDGFVHIAEGFATSGAGSGVFTDFKGKRAMAYYDQDFLNYYYYMASQFAVSDRWFSPIASKSLPNRIATISGGTTQGLVRDPAKNDHLGQLAITTIFQKLDGAQPPVSWKIYYASTNDNCTVLGASTCKPATVDRYPSTTYTYFSDPKHYLYQKTAPNQTCTGTTKDSGTAVGDPNNAFCIDTTKIAPITQLFTDMTSGTLPSFSYIEAAYGANDEHPGSGQSILQGQSEAATIINGLMASPSWADSVFFLSYDEGGGPYDHVPPVPGRSNDKTDKSLLLATGGIPDIGGVTKAVGDGIAVNPDNFGPCLPPAVPGTATLHCDLFVTDPGATPGDAAAAGFGSQLGFRLPNIIVSPFTRRHFVSHIPMDHTAVIRFVEDRFINSTLTTPTYLTNRDAVQPKLLDFFDFTTIPWSVPPVPPAPVTDSSLGRNTCTPDNMGP